MVWDEGKKAGIFILRRISLPVVLSSFQFHCLPSHVSSERNSAHLSLFWRVDCRHHPRSVSFSLSLTLFFPTVTLLVHLPWKRGIPCFFSFTFSFTRREKERSFFIAASRDGLVPLFLASKHEFQVDQSNKDADLSLLSSCHLMLQFVWQFGGFFSFFDLLSDGIWFQSSL